MITDDKGKIVRTPKELQARHSVTVRLADGSAQVGIASVQETLE